MAFTPDPGYVMMTTAGQLAADFAGKKGDKKTERYYYGRLHTEVKAGQFPSIPYRSGTYRQVKITDVEDFVKNNGMVVNLENEKHRELKQLLALYKKELLNIDATIEAIEKIYIGANKIEDDEDDTKH